MATTDATKSGTGNWGRWGDDDERGALNLITPDVVHVLADGRIVKSGGPELAHELEAKGYDWMRAGVMVS